MSITDIKTIAVAGAGTMGALIAQTFASHGYQVVLWNRSEAGLARGRSIMVENLDAVPPAERDAARDDVEREGSAERRYAAVRAAGVGTIAFSVVRKRGKEPVCEHF